MLSFLRSCHGVDAEICQVSYLFHYIEECWKNRQYYKNEQNKLLYWIGGLFVSIVGASGVMGAVLRPGEVLRFTFWHTLMFHVLFVIAWFYYRYKQLNADMYERIGATGQRCLQEAIPAGELPKLITLWEIKGHYLGHAPPMSNGRSLTHTANLLIVVLYLITVTAPIWKGGWREGILSIGWEPLATSLGFLGFLVLGQVLYARTKKRLQIKIEGDWAAVREHLRRGQTTAAQPGQP